MQDIIKISDISKDKLIKIQSDIFSLQQSRNSFVNGLAAGMNIDIEKYSFNMKDIQFELIKEEKKNAKK